MVRILSLFWIKHQCGICFQVFEAAFFGTCFFGPDCVPTWLVVSNVLNSFTSLHNNKRVVGSFLVQSDLMRFMQTKFMVIFLSQGDREGESDKFSAVFLLRWVYGFTESRTS